MGLLREMLGAIIFVFCRCSCARCADHDHCGSAACNTETEQ